MEGQDGKGNNDSNQKTDKRFALWYMGWSSLDRRTTLPMLPWLLAEIRRKSEKNESGPAQAREVQLYLSPPLIRCVPANSSNPSVFIFEHKAQFISRFIHNSHDLSYFAYLIRSQPDNPESEMACHVFKACDPNQVPEVISSIRQVSKVALKEESKPKQDSDESFYNSQKFEVLYCGKVTVSHKKAPSTLIDDCIDKFRQHEIERKRLRLLNGQRSSTEAPVEFIMGEDPLSASLCEVDEPEPNVTEEELSEVGNWNLDLSSSCSTGSLRGAFPECILEDSGFGEQQEIRTRCNSLAGGLQKRSRETGKGSTRRRHASAPNNVQPSDADKNRTMLFQVGRFEVNLISPDTKSVVLEKNFKDISSCSQGVKQTDHFGFICRDVVESGPAQYVCYVFQCASESLVDEVMLTLKQAFTTAAALQSSKNQIKLCEACPMHDLHKLCERIEGLYPPRAKLAIQKYLSQLSDNEQVNIFERVQKMKPVSDHEENELVILHLRQLCETKQKSHVHIGEVPQNASGSTVTSDNSSAGRNKLDVLKNKARSSLTSSLENIFSRVDEVMLTLKQAFTTAAALQSSKNQIKLCEACPMHDLHKLCERIEGLYPPRAKLAIQKYLSQLSDNEQVNIFERVQKMKPVSDHEENELVILHLRQLCETKQKSHVHIGEVPQQGDSPGDSPPGTPPSYVEDDPDAPQFRRRAHTFSHPPIKKKISFTEVSSQASKAPLRRQQSLAPELLQNSNVGFSRVRSVSESESYFSLSSSFHTPTFLKTFYQGSLGSLASLSDNGSLKSGNGEGRKRSLSGCSTDSLTLVPPRRVSWRQKIFLRVASPMNKPSASMQNMDNMDGRELLPLSPRALNLDQDPQVSPLSPEQGFGGEKGRHSPADYRALWKKAIHQQILLIRMEKENQRLEASRDELHIRKMKLDYQEVCQCSKEVQALWDRKLSSPCRTKVQWDKEEIHSAVCQGVPKSRRGEVWLLLSQQYRLRHRLPQRQQPPETPYQDLLKQLTAQQHAILVDLGLYLNKVLIVYVANSHAQQNIVIFLTQHITEVMFPSFTGRTFPTHQYFSTQLGAGQLSLYNLLKAYSLLDTEVGYCQGISFVAGLLLLHMSEEQAFDTLKFLMYDLGIRRQYRPDMISLQIQMYQLSRLLHDYHRNLYTHLEEHEICPSLYAAPWFLTLFASQFPLGFVARIFDLLFVQGTEVIFKVALCLLSSHEGEILECEGFESIVDYLKSTIPTLTHSQMEETITKATEMDISKQLHAYEVEYHVLQDELSDAPPPSEDSDRLDKLEKANAQLKKQNMDLLEKLQAARLKIQTLESSVESFLSRESKMKHLIRSLEQEKASYQKTIERMRSSLPSDAVADVEMTQLKSSTNGKAKETACKKP
ncbi:TBC1 domain family member 4-like isoform X2 [Labeo rohita]|uniref:TBC1 domain family member 4 n=1 Tax=Labeo rohita TaxID=84645 RepID=A0A498L451_LABRO|nr:TBC1 domain family member 4-like isoform X2 [Labeo rohita]